MKKIFSFFAATLMALSGFAATNHIYINNQTGWEAVALYGWYEGKQDINLLGGWPGAQAAGTVEQDGVTYLDYQIEDTAFPVNIIFNNNGGGQQLGDYLMENAGNYYLIAASTGLRPAGEPEPVYVTHHVYVNNTTGWDNFFLYAWGDKDYFGGWPGTQSTAVTTVTKDGVTYLDFPYQVVEDAASMNANLIFHNNVGEGQEGDRRQLITLSEPRDYYLNVPAEGEITEAGRTLVTYHLYVANFTGWDNLFLYAWGDKEYFGTWPGTQHTAVNTIEHEGRYYLDFTYDFYSDVTEMNMNLIFHNNVGEGQEGDQRILITKTVPQNEYISIGEDSSGIENTAVKERAAKTLRNGQLIIVRDGVEFNALGTKL